jgi:hypothetical protein
MKTPAEFAKILYDTSAGCSQAEANREYAALYAELQQTRERLEAQKEIAKGLRAGARHFVRALLPPERTE